MVIVDTTVWVDYLTSITNEHTDWLARELSRQRIGLTDLNLCEVLQGIRSDATFRKVRTEIANFRVFTAGGEDLAVAAAENYRALRTYGVTVRKTIDCLIATFCIASGHSLLHRDRDFDPFEEYLGLRVVHP